MEAQGAGDRDMENVILCVSVLSPLGFACLARVCRPALPRVVSAQGGQRTLVTVGDVRLADLVGQAVEARVEDVDLLNITAEGRLKGDVGLLGRQAGRDEAQPGQAAVNVVVHRQNGLTEAE